MHFRRRPLGRLLPFVEKNSLRDRRSSACGGIPVGCRRCRLPSCPLELHDGLPRSLETCRGFAGSRGRSPCKDSESSSATVIRQEGSGGVPLQFWHSKGGTFFPWVVRTLILPLLSPTPVSAKALASLIIRRRLTLRAIFPERSADWQGRS
jgi:hypothetical protein